jgi:transmembrane sensor
VDELARQVESARKHLTVKWPEERAEAVKRGVPARQRRQQVRRGLAAGVVLLLLALGGALRWPRPPEDGQLHFADGSTAMPLDPDTRLVPEVRSEKRVVVALESGRARFAVVHRPERAFAVKVGVVTIEDRGTRFVVERLGERVRVGVDEGAVRVRWPGGESDLSLGQSGVFPPEPPATATTMEPVAPVETIESDPPRHRAPAPHRWKTLAEEGDFDGAYRELARVNHDEPDDLLAAADVARMSHHPSEAVDYLRRLLRAHAKDPRAPLAAFTLGRVLLDDLGRPAEAAEVFVAAGQLAPDGPLASDALAREVEAWSHAGEAEQAHARAQEYVRRFPAGSRIRSVRRYGGLE